MLFRSEQEFRPDRKLYTVTEKGRAALHTWQSKSPDVFQIRDELLLKVLFGSFASPADLAQNLRKSIGEHEIRLLEYRKNALFLPTRGTFRPANKRPNPYADQETQEDPYFNLIANFAIQFEKTYLQWLYEALEVVEHLQRPSEDKAPSSSS